MDNNLKIHNAINSSNPPCPAISVIIPMYNAEKYVAECLDSILNQTFQNFEVIVVDDCSTDSSVEIVKSYEPKFGGRLILSSMEKNSGSGALPRNKGMNLSRGEYIFFVDSDDLIIKTALEEVYSLAKTFNADVVQCTNNYRIYPDGTRIHKAINQKNLLVEEPTLESENLADRVERIVQGVYRVTPWLKLVQRRLIFEHDLFFPSTRISEDDIWTYGLVCYAKKFLFVPNVIYAHRLTENSVMRKEKTPQQTIKFWLNPILLGLKYLDNFMGKIEFFQQNPQYRYAILEMFVFKKFGCWFQVSLPIQPFAIYDTINHEFNKKLGEHDVLISALCTALNTQQKINLLNQKNFNQIAAQTQKRITELENLNRTNKAYITELENFIIDSQKRIIELKNGLERRVD